MTFIDITKREFFVVVYLDSKAKNSGRLVDLLLKRLPRVMKTKFLVCQIYYEYTNINLTIE